MERSISNRCRSLGERSGVVPVTARDPRSYTVDGCSTTGPVPSRTTRAKGKRPSQAGRREQKERDRPKPDDASKGKVPTGHCVGVHSAVRGRSRRCERTSRSGDTARTCTRKTVPPPERIEASRSRESACRGQAESSPPRRWRGHVELCGPAGGKATERPRQGGGEDPRFT